MVGLIVFFLYLLGVPVAVTLIYGKMEPDSRYHEMDMTDYCVVGFSALMWPAFLFVALPALLGFLGKILHRRFYE